MIYVVAEEGSNQPFKVTTMRVFLDLEQVIDFLHEMNIKSLSGFNICPWKVYEFESLGETGKNETQYIHQLAFP